MSEENNEGGPVQEPTENSAATDLHAGNPDNPGPATEAVEETGGEAETVSDAIEDSRPELDGTDESTDDEVVEQSETVGEEAAKEPEPTAEEIEADRRGAIQRNCSTNMGKKSERKRQTNAPSEPDDD